MTITRADQGQYEAVRGFYHSLIDTVAAAGTAVYIGWKKDIYPAPEFLEESIRRGELYLLMEDGQIAAAMVLNQECNDGYEGIRWRTAADASEVMLIHALGVHPDHAGKGYAKALVREAVRLAEERGMKAIRLDVLEGNIPAERLYTGLGFQYTVTSRMYYEDTGWTNFRLYEYAV